MKVVQTRLKGCLYIFNIFNNTADWKCRPCAKRSPRSGRYRAVSLAKSTILQRIQRISASRKKALAFSGGKYQTRAEKRMEARVNSHHVPMSESLRTPRMRRTRDVFPFFPWLPHLASRPRDAPLREFTSHVVCCRAFQECICTARQSIGRRRKKVSRVRLETKTEIRPRGLSIIIE